MQQSKPPPLGVVIDLPPISNYASVVDVFWSPGASDAVIRYWNYGVDGEGGVEIKYYLASEPFKMLYDLTNLLGETAEDPHWLP